jgi:hypothetical protein
MFGLFLCNTFTMTSSSCGYIVCQGQRRKYFFFFSNVQQVICKSAKLIPVMLGSMIMLKMRYGILDLVGCVLMCVGVAAFVLAGKDSTPHFSPIGISRFDYIHYIFCLFLLDFID